MSNALRPKAEVSLDQHDRYTLEVKYRVPVVGDREKVFGKITTSLLLATGLKISKGNFTSAEAQKAGVQFLRYSTPHWTLANLLDRGNTYSPLYRLDLLVGQSEGYKIPLEEKKLMRAQQKITREIQILGNLVRGIYSPETLGDYPGKNTQALLERIKGLWNTMVRTLEPRFLTEEVQTVFGYIYLTCLEALPPEPLYQNLAESILQELRTNYPRFNPLDVKNQNRLLQWEGQTKRKVQKIFFLPLDKKPGKSATLEFLFGFSAMLAMVFSIGFGYAITTLFSEESFGLAAGLIVAYALKDRIKDFFKNISRGIAAKYLPDRRHLVRDGKTRVKLGLMDDSYGFRKSNTLENPELYRRIDPLEQGVLSSQALHWERSFKLKTQPILESHDREEGLENILRINFNPFLTHAAEPKVHKEIFDGQNIVPWKGIKQYPAYLEIKYWDGEREALRLWKINLTRKGLESYWEIH
jgi:hypothetical protein